MTAQLPCDLDSGGHRPPLQQEFRNRVIRAVTDRYSRGMQVPDSTSHDIEKLQDQERE